MNILRTFLAIIILGIFDQNISYGMEEFYAYEKREVLSYLAKHGYPNITPDRIRRNSNGTAIYIYDSNTYEEKNILIYVDDSGHIKELVPPGRVSYLDDNNQFVAWSDNLSKSIKIGDEVVTLSLYSRIDFSPGGNFYFIAENNIAAIYSTDNPKDILFSVDFMAKRIYSDEKGIYVFGTDIDYYKKNRKTKEIVCAVYESNDGIYSFKRKIIIKRPSPAPSPFGVVDFNPTTKIVMVVDVHDMPFAFLTKWFSFNLDTQEMKKYGRAKYVGLFLSSDFLKY